MKKPKSTGPLSTPSNIGAFSKGWGIGMVVLFGSLIIGTVLFVYVGLPYLTYTKGTTGEFIGVVVVFYIPLVFGLINLIRVKLKGKMT